MSGERVETVCHIMCQNARNWLRKNAKVGDAIRLVNTFTEDFVESLVLIAHQQKLASV